MGEQPKSDPAQELLTELNRPLYVTPNNVQAVKDAAEDALLQYLSSEEVTDFLDRLFDNGLVLVETRRIALYEQELANTDELMSAIKTYRTTSRKDVKRSYAGASIDIFSSKIRDIHKALSDLNWEGGGQ